MQFSGSPSQSVLHLNLSHDNHPIGGVRAKPFSNAFVDAVNVRKTNPNDKKVEKDITELVFFIFIVLNSVCVMTTP